MGYTVLPPLQIPGSPAFRRDDHAIEIMPVFGDAPMQTGSARRERTFASAPRIVTVSLDLRQAALEIFVAWFEGPLRAGNEFFSAQVANQGPGTLWWKARFLSDPKPYTAEYQGGDWWVVSAKLMLFGDGQEVGPAVSALAGGVIFDLISSAEINVGQPLSGGVTFALIPVTGGATGMLSGGVTFALLLGTYVAPLVAVGAAAGSSTVAGFSSVTPVGFAAGTSTAIGRPPAISVGNAAGSSAALGFALTISTFYSEAGATWVGGTSALTVPINNVPVFCKRARTIVGVSLLTLGGSGSCVVDIWKVPIGSYPPTSANSICASAKPTISGGVAYTDTALTGWTTAVNAGDTLMFNLASSGTFTLVAVRLHFSEAF